MEDKNIGPKIAEISVDIHFELNSLNNEYGEEKFETIVHNVGKVFDLWNQDLIKLNESNEMYVELRV